MLTLLFQRILSKPWPEVMQACQLGVEHLLSPRTGAGCSGYISEQDRGPRPMELILRGRSYLSHVSLV